MVALGIYAILGGLRDVDMYARAATDKPRSEVVTAFAVSLIVAGGCATFVSFFGCCGSAISSRPLLLVYAATLAALIAAQITLITLGVVYRNDIDDFLRREIGKDIFTNYKSNLRIAKAWDRLQTNLECCGVESPADWARNNVQSIGFTSAPATQSMSSSSVIPMSCCRVVSGNQCLLRNSYKDGCYDKIIKIIFIDSYYVILGTSLIIIGIECFCLLIVIMLVRMLAHRMSRPYRRSSNTDDDTTALTTSGSRRWTDTDRKNADHYLLDSNGSHMQSTTSKFA